MRATAVGAGVRDNKSEAIKNRSGIPDSAGYAAVNKDAQDRNQKQLPGRNTNAQRMRTSGEDLS